MGAGSGADSSQWGAAIADISLESAGAAGQSLAAWTDPTAPGRGRTPGTPGAAPAQQSRAVAPLGQGQMAPGG